MNVKPEQSTFTNASSALSMTSCSSALNDGAVAVSMSPSALQVASIPPPFTRDERAGVRGSVAYGLRDQLYIESCGCVRGGFTIARPRILRLRSFVPGRANHHCSDPRP